MHKFTSTSEIKEEEKLFIEKRTIENCSNIYLSSQQLQDQRKAGKATKRSEKGSCVDGYPTTRVELIQSRNGISLSFISSWRLSDRPLKLKLELFCCKELLQQGLLRNKAPQKGFARQLNAMRDANLSLRSCQDVANKGAIYGAVQRSSRNRKVDLN